MKDLFWICPNTKKDHWILYLRHHSVGHLSFATSSSLEQIRLDLSVIFKRYRSEYNLINKVNSMSEIPVIGDLEMTRLNGLYDVYKDLYSEVISDTYNEVREEINEMRKKDYPLYKVMARLKKDTSALGHTPVKEVISPAPLTPKPLNRSLLKRINRIKI